ncbi:MAG: ImmA/IrrE family metallo-endopeptidase [Actinomycetota bacterium]
MRATSSGAVLSSLRAELENLGLLVMLFPMKEDGCRGFSLFDESVPVAVVNSAQTAEARIYTLLHEVGHLMRGESTFDTRFNDPRRIERWCDRFAAEFLLPATDLRSYVEKRFGSLVDDLETARSVGRRFKTSLTATCIRLEELGLASTPLIGQIPRREHLKPRSDEEDGFNPDPSTAGKRLREYGESIVRDIFEAERDGRLSRLDVQRYLSLSDEKYPELRGRVDEAFTDPSSS